MLAEAVDISKALYMAMLDCQAFKESVFGVALGSSPYTDLNS